MPRFRTSLRIGLPALFLDRVSRLLEGRPEERMGDLSARLEQRLTLVARLESLVKMKMFGVIEAERMINGKTSHERRLYIGSITPEASALNDDQMRARVKNPGANLAIVRRLVLNLFRLDASKRKSGIHTRRILAASSNSYREALLGLDSV